MADSDDVDIDERMWPAFAKDRGKQYLEESSSDPGKQSGKWSSDLWERIEGVFFEKSALQMLIEELPTEELVFGAWSSEKSVLQKRIEELSTEESDLRKQLEERSSERGLKLSEKPSSDSCKEFGNWSPDPERPKMLENVSRAPEMPSRVESAVEELRVGLEKAELSHTLQRMDFNAPVGLPKFREVDFQSFHQEAKGETSDGLNQEPCKLTLNESNVADSKYVLGPNHNVFLDHYDAQKDLLQDQNILNKGFESHEPDEAHTTNDGGDGMPMKFFNFLKNVGHWEGKGFSLLDIEIYNLASDAIQNDCALRSLLEKVLEAIPSIKDVGVEEASQSIQDQTATVLGFFNASTDNLEFFFKDGETMAKIVGVGMKYAKAIFKPGITIEVQEIEMEEWENIWIGVESGLDTFKTMYITLPTIEALSFEMTSFKKREHEDASDGTSSSSNIGSLQGNVFQVPFLWELSKYFIIGKVIDALHLKSNVDTSSDKSKINIVEDCSKESSGTGTSAMEQVAKEAAREAIISYLSNMRIGSSHPNNNQKNQEGEGGSGDGNNGGDEFHQQGKLPIDLDGDKFYTTKVKVQLLHGGDFFMKSQTDIIPLLDTLSQSY